MVVVLAVSFLLRGDKGGAFVQAGDQLLPRRRREARLLR
jgi:hypothetical protein